MYFLACTRFTNNTYLENQTFRTLHGVTVVYGCSIAIRQTYSNARMFVLEMNNDTNRIEGVGFIKATPYYRKSLHIHENTVFNQVAYVGFYWWSREHFLNSNHEPMLCELEKLLFTGKSHMKRHIGITVLTDKQFTRSTLITLRGVLKVLKRVLKETKQKRQQLTKQQQIQEPIQEPIQEHVSDVPVS